MSLKNIHQGTVGCRIECSIPFISMSGKRVCQRQFEVNLLTDSVISVKTDMKNK